VAKITGVLPMTSRNLVAEPKIANWHDYEVRYASMSTIALIEGGPVPDTLDDAAFIRFYGDRPGWNEHRAFSIVAAADPQSTCGLYDPDEDLFLTTTLRGTPQDKWGALGLFLSLLSSSLSLLLGVVQGFWGLGRCGSI
jgi:hypothetical protein